MCTILTHGDVTQISVQARIGLESSIPLKCGPGQRTWNVFETPCWKMSQFIIVWIENEPEWNWESMKIGLSVHKDETDVNRHEISAGLPEGHCNSLKRSFLAAVIIHNAHDNTLSRNELTQKSVDSWGHARRDAHFNLLGSRRGSFYRKEGKSQTKDLY